MKRFVGRELEMVAETAENGWVEGYSENYIRLYVKDDGGEEPTHVRVEGLYKDGVLAVRAD